MSDTLKDQLLLESQIRSLEEKLALEREKRQEGSKTISHLSKELRDAQRRFDLVTALNANTRRSHFAIKAKTKTSESVACVMLSDWHAEEEVLPEKVSGLNRYNLDVCSARIDKLAQAVPYLIDQFRAGTRIDTLIVHLGGDMMTGNIHPELTETNALSPIRTVLFLQEKLEALLRFWRENTKCRIICLCNVGNHGRTTEKRRIKTRTDNSYEYLLFRWLAKTFPEFDWRIAEGYHLYLDVYGAKWRTHHGDAIQYQGGVGGITIPINKALAQWDKAVTAHLDLFGHWHQYKQDPKWLCNGSLIGYSDHSLEIKADYEPPKQTFFLWEKDHGRTITTPIFV